MKYSVVFRPEAEWDLSKLDKSVAQRILNRIKWLAENLQKTRIERLQGSRWRGLYQLARR